MNELKAINCSNFYYRWTGTSTDGYVLESSWFFFALIVFYLHDYSVADSAAGDNAKRASLDDRQLPIVFIMCSAYESNDKRCLEQKEWMIY